MIKNFKKYALVIPVISTIVLMASSALADLPAGNAITPDDISGIIGVIAQFMIDISLVLAVIFIVLSGIMTMMAQDDPTRFKNGLARLKSAIWGVVIVMATGVIINTVGSLIDRSFFCQISFLGICLY